MRKNRTSLWIISFFLCCTLAFTLIEAPSADAKPRTGYKSPRGSYQQPVDRTRNNYTQPSPQTGTRTPGAVTNPTPTRGFTGGGFWRGMALGGLAGLLFGGVFGQMGGFGSFLGLAVNVFGLLVVLFAVRAIFRFFANKRGGQRRY